MKYKCREIASAYQKALAELAPRIRIVVTWTGAGTKAEFRLQERLPFQEAGHV